MLGLLRVVPSAESKRQPRSVTLRQIPSVDFVEALVGGNAHIIETFDTLLNGEGVVVPCVVVATKDETKPVNTWMDLLHLQAMIRKDGFSGTDRDGMPPIRGTAVILQGDDAFMNGLV